MAGFTPYTAAQLLQAELEAYAVEAATPANTGLGSTLLAMFEASVILALQLQQQIVYLFQVARLGTSEGPDVDSFVNPFGVFRNGPNGATGQVTFTYPNAVTQQQVILVGSGVQTTGGVIFNVIADASNPNYVPGLNGYPVNIGQTSTSATVQCSQTGIIGNVLPNTIVLPFGGNPPIPGSPAINNPAEFTNGLGSETDQALKVRFALFESGGGEGTVNSIIAEAETIQSSLTLAFGDQVQSVLVGQNWTFTSGVPGWFTIIADIAGAPGTITPAQIQAIQGNASLPGTTPGIMFGYRGAGISYNVVAPILITVNGGGNVILAPGANPTTVLAAVDAAFTTFINGIGLNLYGGSTTCSIMALYVALKSVPGLQEVTNLSINGQQNTDLQAPFGSEFVAGSTTGFQVG